MRMVEGSSVAMYKGEEEEEEEEEEEMGRKKRTDLFLTGAKGGMVAVVVATLRATGRALPSTTGSSLLTDT